MLENQFICDLLEVRKLQTPRSNDTESGGKQILRFKAKDEMTQSSL
jgi:hypothetical protein